MISPLPSRQFLLELVCSWADLAMATCSYIASALPWAAVGLNTISYLYIAKANAHLWVLPEAWGDTDLCSMNSDVSALWSVCRVKCIPNR